MNRIIIYVGATATAIASLAACSQLSTPANQQSLVTLGATLATIAAENNTQAATLIMEGQAICGKTSSVPGQLLEGTAIAVLNSAGVPVKVTGAAADAVADTCHALGLMPGPLPSGTAPAALPTATVPQTALPPA